MATIPTDHFFCTRQICSAEVRKINAPLSQTYQSGTTQKTILNKNSMIAKINKLFAKYLIMFFINIILSSKSSSVLISLDT